MIDGLRWKLEEYINNPEGQDWNRTSNLKECITSRYYPDVLRAFRETTDMSFWNNEDGSLYFLPFRIDVIWDEEKYTAAFTSITVWEHRYDIMIDSSVQDDFSNVDDFIDVVIDLTEHAERIKNTFNSLRPIYNEL